MTEPLRFTYVGPARGAHMLATELRSIGCQPDYETPMERRDFQTAMDITSVIFTVLGSGPEIIDRVRQWVTRHPEAEVRGLPDSGAQTSIEARLDRAKALLDNGVISEEEHAEHRSRILGDL